jgi:hypothetical protein
MVQVRREAILSKARGPYQQRTIHAWAAEATPDRAVRYARDITDPQSIVLVAESGGELLGFAMAVPAKEELSAIYVKPNRVGRVGHALLSAVEGRAFQTAEALICIAALSAVPFYAANGYSGEKGIDYVDGSGAGVPCMQMKKHR